MRRDDLSLQAGTSRCLTTAGYDGSSTSARHSQIVMIRASDQHDVRFSKITHTSMLPGPDTNSPTEQEQDPTRVVSLPARPAGSTLPACPPVALSRTRAQLPATDLCRRRTALVAAGSWAGLELLPLVPAAQPRCLAGDTAMSCRAPRPGPPAGCAARARGDAGAGLGRVRALATATGEACPSARLVCSPLGLKSRGTL